MSPLFASSLPATHPLLWDFLDSPGTQQLKSSFLAQQGIQKIWFPLFSRENASIKIQNSKKAGVENSAGLRMESMVYCKDHGQSSYPFSPL